MDLKRLCSAFFVKVYDYDSLPFCISFKFHMPSYTAKTEICVSENYMLKHKGLQPLSIKFHIDKAQVPAISFCSKLEGTRNQTELV